MLCQTWGVAREATADVDSNWPGHPPPPSPLNRSHCEHHPSPTRHLTRPTCTATFPASDTIAIGEGGRA
eukprot:9471395-Pyramimonas_sp.AAC.1